MNAVTTVVHPIFVFRSSRITTEEVIMTKTNVLYQHGTLALLVPGLLKGTLTSGELLEHGDTGIGTGRGSTAS